MFKSIGKLFAVAAGKRSAGENVFHPSEKCPECGTQLMRMAEAWRCPNLDCPAQIRARIEHWCSPDAMDISGGDAALVAQLVDKGLVRDVAELYRLRVAEIAALPGMNQNCAQKFFDAITASQTHDAWRTLFGLGIPEVNPDTAKSLCRLFGAVDNVFAASVERLMKADGVSDAVARSIVYWGNDSVNRKLVKRLFKAGVNFKLLP